MNVYYVAQDVELAIRSRIEDWPKYWTGVHAYPEFLEVILDEDLVNKSDKPISYFENESISFLQSLFTEERVRVKNGEGVFILDSPSNQVKELVIKILPEKQDTQDNKEDYIRPLFRGNDRFTSQTKYPEPFLTPPSIFAFHSYKGGVGRTLSVLSFSRVLGAKHKISKEGNPKILIVDADLEAPGLTWLVREQHGGFRDFSLLDAFSLIHETKNWKKDILPFIASKVKEEILRIPANGKDVEVYFLPAYRTKEQLFSLPDVPAPFDLIQPSDRNWIIGDFFFQLGRELGLDTILIDLRAGLSEYASPFIFDPRIQTFFVTNTSLQSIEGMKWILAERNRRIPPHSNYPVPQILLSMVTKDAEREIGAIEEEFRTIYLETEGNLEEEDVIDEKFLPPIVTLPFTEELVHLKNLKQIDQKLSGTMMEKAINKIIDDLFPSSENISAAHYVFKDHFLKKLNVMCKEMEYAERTSNSNYLVTIPLRNLVNKYSKSLPAVVMMGAKGSGKTYLYLQMINKMNWYEFTQPIVRDTGTMNALFLPLLSSRNLNDPEMVRKTWMHNKKQIPSPQEYEYNRDSFHVRITSKLKSIGDNEFEWQEFWFEEIARLLGLSTDKKWSVIELDEYLKQIDQRVILLVDGLEDIFTKTATDETEQAAIRGLIQGVSHRIRELPHSNLGLIVFIRKDMARNSITQNFGQFSSLYEPFELHWNQEESLRLALWICEAVDKEWRNIHKDIEIENLGRELIEKSLLPLWGLKLGKDESKEAYTANWVVSALSDFNGNLQARDMVRFLYQASNISLQQESGGYNGRYLQPSAVRSAIEYCSEKKVSEIQDEIPTLKPIFHKITNAKTEFREVPLDLEKFNLTSHDIHLLESLGIIFKYDDLYFVPEIFRRGLKLRLKKGARPKVIHLLKRALNKS